MATLKDGIFGGISGKVGSVVGATWKGVPYVRSLPRKTKDPKTTNQLKQRIRFNLTMDFLRKITPLIRVGFQTGEEIRMTAFNAAMSYNMKHAIRVGDDGLELDYPNVLIANGVLGGARGCHAEAENDTLCVCWESAPLPDTRHDDMAVVLAYNPSKQESEYDLNAGKRKNGKAELPLPEGWKGDEIETYLAFRSADGSRVSNSIYTGRHKVI